MPTWRCVTNPGWHGGILDAMQIGIDISRIAVEARTGTEQYSYELLAALADIDRYTAYTLYANRLPTSLPPLGPNFRLRQISFPRLWTHLRLSAEILTHPPDVLFIPAHVIPLAAPFARRSRMVVTIHDLGYLHFPEAHTAAQRLQLKLTTRWSARVARHVIAISEATRQDLIRHAGIPDQKIHVVPHGVSARFRPADDPGQIQAIRERYGIQTPNYMLYVGTLQPRKNLPRLIEAFARAVPTLKQPCKLILAGKKGWLAEPILELASQFGMSQHVQFTGYVDDKHLPTLIAGAQIFVLPSLYEGFGMPVLEAMACGVPVLCANSAALPEVAGNAALLVDPLDTQAIASGITELANNSVLWEQLRERGLARAAEYSWERCARSTLEVLRDGA